MVIGKLVFENCRYTWRFFYIVHLAVLRMCFMCIKALFVMYLTSFKYNKATKPGTLPHQGCDCKDGDCTSGSCACSALGVRCWYSRGRLLPSFPYHDPPMLFECNQTCGCNLVRYILISPDKLHLPEKILILTI